MTTTALDLYALSEPELADALHRWGQPRFRAKQIRHWLYHRGVADVGQMHDLPKALRERLAQEAQVGSLRVETEQASKDGTLKRLYRLADDQRIEAVLMPYRDGRQTACISSQAGCAMGCVFCATGQMGFGRHLTSAEIFEQAARYAAMLKARDARLSNVVFMGMGEPFHNYEAVLEATRRLMGDLGIGARHITISTVGVVPGIRRFAQEGLQVKLAVSLHSTSDEERSGVMPVNRRWPIAELLDACREYADRTRRRITFEWALIAGKNDGVEQAEHLGELLRGLPCHVNLIPLNPTARYDGKPTDPQAAERFVATLGRHGVPATLRVRRGIDIDAGCGQLASRQGRKE